MSDDRDRPKPLVVSEIAWSSADQITVRGLDLPSEILGHMDIGEFSFLQLTGRRPTAGEATVYNAIIVTLIEHGITPSVIAARMTYSGAPESLQAAVAAGISGLGTVFVGSMEGAARVLYEALPRGGAADDLKSLARKVVADHRSARIPIPGLGHPFHKPIDPRTPRLFELAQQNGLAGSYTTLMQLIAEQAAQTSGRELPINATGAIGAICCELGFDWQIVRGLGVMARAIGLIGHLNEERERPMARAIWQWTDAEADSARRSES